MIFKNAGRLFNAVVVGVYFIRVRGCHVNENTPVAYILYNIDYGRNVASGKTK